MEYVDSPLGTFSNIFPSTLCTNHVFNGSHKYLKWCYLWGSCIGFVQVINYVLYSLSVLFSPCPRCFSWQESLNWLTSRQIGLPSVNLLIIMHFRIYVVQLDCNCSPHHFVRCNFCSWVWRWCRDNQHILSYVLFPRRYLPFRPAICPVLFNVCINLSSSPFTFGCRWF